MTNESKLAMFDKWTETRDKEEYLRLGAILFPTATREEMSDLFDESRAGYLHEQEGSEKAKKPQPTLSSENWLSPEMMDKVWIDYVLAKMGTTRRRIRKAAYNRTRHIS